MPGRDLKGDYRYAYQGQEVDPETGKEAFELRLWDARIGRWLTTDPYSQYNSPYLGMGNNPITMVDPDGGKADDWFKNKDTGEIKWFDNDSEAFSDLDGNEWHNTGFGNELLTFNGVELTFNQQIRSGAFDYELRNFSFGAVSGRPLEDGTFDYSLNRQAINSVGPLPEWDGYFINKKEIQKFSDASFLNQVVSTTGLAGLWKGGTTAWGNRRAWIQPQQVNFIDFQNIDGQISPLMIARSGFSIHGGSIPGSAGCIDLHCNADAFFNTLDNLSIQNKIHLIVKYSNH